MSAFPVSDAVETSSLQPVSVAFHREAHAKYFRSILNVMPSPYASLDTSRMTAFYFSVVGLDILGQLDSVNKQEIVDYIYTLQLANSRKGVSSAGFIGGSFANHLVCGVCKAEGPNATVTVAESCASCPFPHSIHEDYHQGHIAMTYTALMSLTTLGDDLSRVNRAHTLEGKKPQSIAFYNQHVLNSIYNYINVRSGSAANAQWRLPVHFERQW